jgi:hypothetical protein
MPAGASGAAVHRSPGVATAVFPNEPERAVYNNTLLERDLAAAERADALDAMEAAYAAAGVTRFAAWAPPAANLAQHDRPAGACSLAAHALELVGERALSAARGSRSDRAAKRFTDLCRRPQRIPYGCKFEQSSTSRQGWSVRGRARGRRAHQSTGRSRRR